MVVFRTRYGTLGGAVGLLLTSTSTASWSCDVLRTMRANSSVGHEHFLLASLITVVLASWSAHLKIIYGFY